MQKRQRLQRSRTKVVDTCVKRNLLTSPDNFFLSLNKESESYDETRRIFQQREGSYSRSVQQFQQLQGYFRDPPLRQQSKSPPRSPPRTFKKGILGWYDPLDKKEGHAVEAIDGVCKRWQEEDEEEILSRIFDSSIAIGDSGSTSSDDISQDSVEQLQSPALPLKHHATALTILQKWLHMAKINLRIKRVAENRAMV